MDKEQLIKRIRDAADVFKPLLGKLRSVSDGENPQQVFILPEPYALAWWSLLVEMAAMLEYQESPVTDKQLRHIKGTLGVWGGNGTLANLWFNAGDYKEESAAANQALKEQIRILREFFGDGPRSTESAN